MGPVLRFEDTDESCQAAKTEIVASGPWRRNPWPATTSCAAIGGMVDGSIVVIESILIVGGSERQSYTVTPANCIRLWTAQSYTFSEFMHFARE